MTPTPRELAEHHREATAYSDQVSTVLEAVQTLDKSIGHLFPLASLFLDEYHDTTSTLRAVAQQLRAVHRIAEHRIACLADLMAVAPGVVPEGQGEVPWCPRCRRFIDPPEITHATNRHTLCRGIVRWLGSPC